MNRDTLHITEPRSGLAVRATLCLRKGAVQRRIPAPLSGRPARGAGAACDVDRAGDFLPDAAGASCRRRLGRAAAAGKRHAEPRSRVTSSWPMSPARVWGGNPDPIFDIGLFYGPGARMFFPDRLACRSASWRSVRADDRAALAEACGRIRRNGACDDHVLAGGRDGMNDGFELYDLRVEIIAPQGAKIYCGTVGDWFELRGEQVHLPPGQSFLDLFAVGPPAAAARQAARPTAPMTG